MNYLMHSILIIAFGLISMGCGSLHESYVDADQDTYEYAQPKLEAWAEMKKAAGDAEWVPIVKDKGIAWKARITRAKKKIKEDESDAE